MISVSLLVTDRCFSSSLYSVVDAFNGANSIQENNGKGALFTVSVVSMDGNPVKSQSGYEVPVDNGILDSKNYDLVVVIPSIVPDETNENIDYYLSELKSVFAWLKQQFSYGSILASSCTGSFLLAEAGLLNGKKATSHWRSEQAFRSRYPGVILESESLITDNGSLVCGGGATAHVNLAVHLIRRFTDKEFTFHCTHYLVSDPGRVTQSPYALMAIDMKHEDSLVSKVQKYIESNYDTPLAVQEVAEKFHVSTRTLMRRFKSATKIPIGLYTQGIRVDQARKLLATTKKPLKSIVFDVGYEDFSSFARLFKNKTGITMQSYRERFGLEN